MTASLWEHDRSPRRTLGMLRAAVLADSKPPMMYPCPLSSAEAKLLRGAGIDALDVYWSRMTSYFVILRKRTLERSGHENAKYTSTVSMQRADARHARPAHFANTLRLQGCLRRLPSAFLHSHRPQVWQERELTSLRADRGRHVRPLCRPPGLTGRPGLRAPPGAPGALCLSPGMHRRPSWSIEYACVSALLVAGECVTLCVNSLALRPKQRQLFDTRARFANCPTLARTAHGNVTRCVL